MLQQPDTDETLPVTTVAGSDMLAVRRIIDRARILGMTDARRLAELLDREGLTTVGGRRWTGARLRPYLHSKRNAEADSPL